MWFLYLLGIGFTVFGALFLLIYINNSDKENTHE